MARSIEYTNNQRKTKEIGGILEYMRLNSSIFIFYSYHFLTDRVWMLNVFGYFSNKCEWPVFLPLNFPVFPNLLT